jgi:phosphopantothenoylcysteine decarboxylase/phosphopantothenate--cysteine ligase
MPDAAVPRETRSLDGLRVLVAAGPTHEDLDPVRYLGNRSSGKMGYAIVERAIARGAEVTLVAGPVSLPDPVGCADVVKVRSALEMHEAVTGRSDANDVIIMTAAVADYRPKHVSLEKIKKGGDVAIELVRNPDILKDLGERREGPLPVLVGFALETTDVEAYARGKLVSKKADLVVANEAKDGFGGDDNVAMLVSEDATVPLPRMSKRDLADRILDRALALYRRALP